jgi:hypothetical protein
MWKKCCYSFTLFSFGYSVLKGEDPYVIFYVFFIIHLGKKFNWVLLTFMHITLLVMVTYFFHKWRHYFKILFFNSSFKLFATFILFKPFLAKNWCIWFYFIHSVFIAKLFLSLDFCILFFIFISLLVVIGLVFYKSKDATSISNNAILWGYFLLIGCSIDFLPFFALALFPFENEER